MKIRLINYCLLAATCFAFTTRGDADKNQVLLQAIMQGLSEVHYQPQELNDEFSNRVYDLYLKRLDYNKKFLLKEDVNKLEKFRNQLDDEVKASSFEFFELSYDLITERTKEAEGYYQEILEKPFEFTANESEELDPKKISFAASKGDLKNEWRKYLKYQVMVRVADDLDAQDKAKEKEKEKPDTSFHPRSFEQIEADARKKVLKANKDYFKRLNGITKKERLAGYLDVITNTYDPHTEYFAPKDKQEFDATMSGHFEGIGAQLEERDDVIKVTKIIPGSASYKQGQLKQGDIIMKVAQGKADPVDLTGMRLDDAVQLIRGKKGTEVRLTVKKSDGTIVIIPIIRAEVQIEETFAKSAILNYDGKKVGYIRLPEFYADFEHRNSRRSADDVKKELVKLKADNVDGIVLDLRNNGGGSLDDAVKMAGLFFSTGPVVQVKERNDHVKVYDDYDEEVVWGGPLAVMVNTNSASASEILAAAVQDYKRGIIIGSPSTFGKGTVQQFFNMDDFINGEYSADKPFGSVKITIQKFYRINGGSTQIKGVVPDVIIPDPYAYVDEHEKDQDYPLKYDEIAPAKYDTWKSPVLNYNSVEKLAKEREKANPNFGLMNEEALKFKKKKDDENVTLNLQKYRDEQKKMREENKKYDGLNKEIEGLELTNPSADMADIQADSTKIARNKEWFKGLKKDIYLYESARIVEDIKK